MKSSFVLLCIGIILVIAVIFLCYQSQGLKRIYTQEVLSILFPVDTAESKMIDENEIRHLPIPIQKYLQYTGVIGKEELRNVRIRAEGQFKLDMEKDWSDIKIEQFNFYGDELARMSLMRLKASGFPIVGLDTYIDGKGSMLGKIAGLFTVVNGKGTEMDQSEAAVLLSEMCGTPAALIDQRIQWDTIDQHTVRASLQDHGSKVSGILHFNEQGELVEFETEDKLYQEKDGTYSKVRWSVLLGEYKEIEGRKLSTFSEAVWHFPKGDFTYGKIYIKEYKVNCSSFR